MYRKYRPSGRRFQVETVLEFMSRMGLSECYVWGSRVRGDYVHNSDWDILVKGYTDINLREKAKRVGEDMGIIVDFNSVANPQGFPNATRVCSP